MKAWYRNRVISVVLNILFLTLVSTVTWFVLESIEKKTKQGIRESLQTVLNTTQDAQQIWISHKKEDIAALANDLHIIELVQSLTNTYENDGKRINQDTLNTLRNLLNPHVKKHGDTGFFVIDRNRHNIASMRDSNLGTLNLIHLQKPALLNRAFGGETLLVPTIRSDIPLDGEAMSIYDRVPTMFVVTPIYDDQRKVNAVLALRMDPALNFTRITQLGRVGETGETYAFDDKAYLISESRFDHHLRRVGIINPVKKAYLISVLLTREVIYWKVILST